MSARGADVAAGVLRIVTACGTRRDLRDGDAFELVSRAWWAQLEAFARGERPDVAPHDATVFAKRHELYGSVWLVADGKAEHTDFVAVPAALHEELAALLPAAAECVSGRLRRRAVADAGGACAIDARPLLCLVAVARGVRQPVLLEGCLTHEQVVQRVSCVGIPWPAAGAAAVGAYDAPLAASWRRFGHGKGRLSDFVNAGARVVLLTCMAPGVAAPNGVGGTASAAAARAPSAAAAGCSPAVGAGVPAAPLTPVATAPLTPVAADYIDAAEDEDEVVPLISPRTGGGTAGGGASAGASVAPAAAGPAAAGPAAACECNAEDNSEDNADDNTIQPGMLQCAVVGQACFCSLTRARVRARRYG